MPGQSDDDISNVEHDERNDNPVNMEHSLQILPEHVRPTGLGGNENDVVGLLNPPRIVPMNDIATTTLHDSGISDYSIDVVDDCKSNADRDQPSVEERTETTLMNSSSSTSRRRDRSQRRAERIRQRQQLGAGSHHSATSHGTTSSSNDSNLNDSGKLDFSAEVTSQPPLAMQQECHGGTVTPLPGDCVTTSTGSPSNVNRPLSSRSDDLSARRQQRRAERRNRRQTRGIPSESSHSANTMSDQNNSSFGSLRSDYDDVFSSVVQQYASPSTNNNVGGNAPSSPTNVLVSTLEEPTVASPTARADIALEVPTIPSPSNLLVSNLQVVEGGEQSNNVWTTVARNTSTASRDAQPAPPPPPLLPSTPRYADHSRAASLPVPGDYQLNKRDLGSLAPYRSRSAQELQPEQQQERQQPPGAYFVPGRAIGYTPAWATRQRHSDGQSSRRQRGQSRLSFWRRRSSTQSDQIPPSGRRSSFAHLIRGVQAHPQASEEVTPDTDNNNDNVENANLGAWFSPEAPPNHTFNTTNDDSDNTANGTAHLLRREPSRMILDAACRLMSMRIGRARSNIDQNTDVVEGDNTSGAEGTNGDGDASSPSSSKLVKLRLVAFLGAVVLIISSTVGVAVRITQKRKNQDIEPGAEREKVTVDTISYNVTFSPEENDLRARLEYLTEDPAAYENLKSPQYIALKWLANEDEASISENDKQRIEHRFALAVLFLSTNETGWRDQNNFMSPVHECNWTDSDGLIQGGIICDSSSHITHLQLGKFHCRSQHDLSMASLSFLECESYQHPYF